MSGFGFPAAFPDTRHLTPDTFTQIASLTLARWKLLTFIAGTTIGVPTELFSPAATRVGLPSISMLLSISASDWLNRKLVTGRLMRPFFPLARIHSDLLGERVAKETTVPAAAQADGWQGMGDRG